nr:RNA-directed DNA polymerase, eukaryota, reverse transcriptase zinc-binding domain protein [Tanacetum cinerariifolium]
MNVGSEEKIECLDKQDNCSGVININNGDCVETMIIGKDNANSSNEDVNVVTEKSEEELVSVPSQISENENGIVIFDDEIIELESKKWNLKVCGQFIGCSMGFNEDRYHNRRMCSRLGLKDVIDENGVFYFKFQDEERIKEAWSLKGISALASSIGKPIIIDEVTTKMRVTRIGRIGFARVLMEIDAEKGIKDKIEIMYKSKNVAEGTKKGFREYVDQQIFLKVIGWRLGLTGCVEEAAQHSHLGLRIRPALIDRKTYRRRRDDAVKGKSVNVSKGKITKTNEMNINNKEASGGNMEKKDNKIDNGKMNQEGSTSVGNSNGKGMLGSNRFTLLDSLVNEKELTPNTDQRKIIDEFLSNKSTAKNMEMNGWSEDIKRYYRDKKELFDAAQDMEKNEDVLDENFGVENTVLRNEVEGIGRDILN